MTVLTFSDLDGMMALTQLLDAAMLASSSFDELPSSALDVVVAALE